MEIRIFQVDAFTNEPFKGNPAAVCPLEEPLPPDAMQAIALENNLAETAFVQRENGAFRLRWFTPAVEVDLCGHATLATAHILWQETILPQGTTAIFNTRSGELRASRAGDWIELDFPAIHCRPCEFPEKLTSSLGAKIIESGESEMYYLAEVSSLADLCAIKPDFITLAAFKPIIVTARSDAGSRYNFHSRMFGPSVGINEDPVTGSAHCQLATYWASKLGKNDFFAHQASARGGEMKVVLKGQRVLLSGQAVTVMKGAMEVRL